MSEKIKLQNNVSDNGYIYVELNKRITELSDSVNDVIKTLNTAKDDLNISVKDYNSIIKSLSNLVSIENFKAHCDDSNIHVNTTQVKKWNRKLDLEDLEHIELEEDENGNINNANFKYKSKDEIYKVPIKIKKFNK